MIRLNLAGRLDYIQTVGAAFSPRASIVVQPKPGASFRFVCRAARYDCPRSSKTTCSCRPGSVSIPGVRSRCSVPILAVGNEDSEVARSDGMEVGFSGNFARRHTLSACSYHVIVDGEIQFGTSETRRAVDLPPGWPLPPALVPEGVLPQTSTFRNVGRLRSLRDSSSRSTPTGRGICGRG